MTEGMAAASLQTLSQLLEKHYSQKVILLIDEYDVPLDKAFQSGYYDELLEFYGLSSYKDVIRGWYDGYRFGNTDIYCLWDVINYCDELLTDPCAEPENYWANTSGNDLIQRLLEKANQSTRNEVEQLVNGETITKTIRQELTYREVEDSIDNIWSVLYSTGYLTCRRRVPGKKMELALPNWKVRELFIDLVKDWFEETTQADSGRISRFCAAFPAGDTNTIQEMLGDYLWDSGLLQSQDSWLVKSNAETGGGYSDISVQTPERTGIVIEVKYADDGNLEKACGEALKQIEEKKYAEGVKRRGTKKIVKYGIVFFEKECMVAMRSK